MGCGGSKSKADTFSITLVTYFEITSNYIEQNVILELHKLYLKNDQSYADLSCDINSRCCWNVSKDIDGALSRSLPSSVTFTRF